MIKCSWLLVIIIICVDYTVVCDDPKVEVELLPGAMKSERKKVQIFWSIMYEVCRTFCLWKKFCGTFCELFNPDDEPQFDMDFFTSSKSSRQTLWLYDTASKICEQDLECVDKCLKMDLNKGDHDETLHSKETTEEVFITLYEIAKRYFIRCAQQNDKPEENVQLMAVDEFCKEITLGWNEYVQQCINSLT